MRTFGMCYMIMSTSAARSPLWYYYCIPEVEIPAFLHFIIQNWVFLLQVFFVIHTCNYKCRSQSWWWHLVSAAYIVTRGTQPIHKGWPLNEHTGEWVCSGVLQIETKEQLEITDFKGTEVGLLNVSIHHGCYLSFTCTNSSHHDLCASII